MLLLLVEGTRSVEWTRIFGDTGFYMFHSTVRG